MDEAFQMLCNHAPPKSSVPKVRLSRRPVLGTDDEEQELGFYQEDEDSNQHATTLGTKGKSHPSIKLNCCKKLRRCKVQCP